MANVWWQQLTRHHNNFIIFKSQFENMDQLLCKLCQNTYKTPKMCPHCSQIFCHLCITNYLAAKHFCPVCDNYIIDLIDCARIMQEVKEVVIHKQKSDHADMSIGQNLKCSLHNLQLNYFCQTCQNWICSDCGVIDEEHREHRVLNKEQAKEMSKKLINDQLSKLEEIIYKLHTKKEKCSLDMEVYKTELKWCRARIQQYFQSVLERANIEGTKKIRQFQEQIKEHEAMLLEFRNQKYLLEQLMAEQKNTGFQKIRVPNLDSGIQELNHQIIKIQTINEIIPVFTNFTFEFDYDNNIDEFFIYSPYYQLWGQEWRIKIYPKGNSAAEGKYLSVFLQLSTGYQLNKQKRYVYRIQLLSLNRAGSTIVKQFCSGFEPGESWGYSDYLFLHELQQYLHEGRLIFLIGVRNQTYEGLSQDLKMYSQKLSKQNKILEQLLCQSNYQKEIDNSSIAAYEISKDVSLLSSLE